MGKKTKTTEKAPSRPRNPHARALKESGLFKPKVVPAEKDVYRRRPKHPKDDAPGEES